MSESSENGYVTRNSEMPTIGHLVIYSVTGGRVTYSSFAGQARTLGLPQSFVPPLRKLFYAFANAKNNLNEMSLPSLEVSDEWDGVVERKVKVLSLERNREYVVQIESRGRARGKKHVSSQNMFRLEFTPPEGFDVQQWSQDYMNHIWEGNEEAAEETTAQIRECISVTPYWDDSEIDANLFARITSTLMTEFVTVATSIDGKMLRDRVVKVLKDELGGLSYKSGQGAWFIPKYNDDDSYLETLRSYSQLLETFGNVNSLTRPTGEANWFGDDGKPQEWHRPQTNLRILGYIDDEEAIDYIRKDIETNLGREIGEYQQKLMEVANNFNDEKIEQFEKRLDAISGMREGLMNRLSNLTSVVKTVNLDTKLYDDVASGLRRSTSRIRSIRSSAADRLAALSRLN